MRTEDVYVSVCAYSERVPGGRGRADIAGALFGMWADIDVSAPGVHEKPGLPPTKDEARRILAAVDEPTYIIDTGFGLQAWWFFHEPLILDTPELRQKAAEMAQNWQRHIARVARGMGYSVDSVGDLARILRIPGTMNHKVDPPLPVRIISDSGILYQPKDLDVGPGEEEAPVQEAKTEVKLSPEKIPEGQPEEFTLLVANLGASFTSLFDHTTALMDSSMSGYDLAIANKCRSAGLDEQQTYRVLLWHYKHHNRMPKPMSYYRRTIAKAFAGGGDLGSRDAMNVLVDTTERIVKLVSEGREDECEEPRQLLLEALASLLGVAEIVDLRVFCAGGEHLGAEMQVRLRRGGPVFAMATKAFARWRRMSDFVMDFDNALPHICAPKLGREEWSTVYAGIRAAAVRVDVGDDVSPASMAIRLLYQYLVEKAWVYSDGTPITRKKLEELPVVGSTCGVRCAVFRFDDFYSYALRSGDMLVATPSSLSRIMATKLQLKKFRPRGGSGRPRLTMVTLAALASALDIPASRIFVEAATRQQQEDPTFYVEAEDTPEDYFEDEWDEE